MSSILHLARPDILALQPYQHAAWIPTLERMHANEMPWRAEGDDTQAGLNRYPEPQPRELLEHLANLYGVAPDSLIAGRGSDEGIDLLVRTFCRAGQDNVLICPPTFGMYKVSARVQGAGVIEVPLLKEQGFALDVEAILRAQQDDVKIVFLCSPNNPTGDSLDQAAIERLCRALSDRALVVLDEAYIEFARARSFASRLAEFPNLAILRTLSKAYALAGARCGAVLAAPEIIEVLKRVITPYALPTQTIESVLTFTDGVHRLQAQQRIAALLRERERVADALRSMPGVLRVWPSDSNFLLIDCAEPDRVLQAARTVGLIIRDPRAQPALKNSLRISIGSPEQNDRLLLGVQQAMGVAA